MLPPGPRAAPIVNLARYARRPLEVLSEWRSRYGDIFTVRLPAVGAGVYVADPAAIRDLFTGDQSDLRAGEGNAFLAPILGSHSLLVLDDQEHARQRRLLFPPFKGNHVSEFRDLIRDLAAEEVARWDSGRRLVLRDRMRHLTFEVICRTVFGVTDPERVARLRGALISVIDSSAAYLLVARAAEAKWGPFTAAHRFARRLRAADDLLYAEIARRRADDQLASQNDVLSLLLRARDENGRALSDPELRDHLFTVLAAGYETTATALAFALEFLLHNLPALKRLREELMNGEGEAYLQAIVKETLRLRPVIGHVPRTLTTPRLVAGWELSAGTKVHPVIVLAHLREDVYPDAAQFRPERFLADGRSRDTWVPFGGGVRRCLGAALAQAEMAEVLRIVCCGPTLRPLRDRQDPVVLRGVTLAPKYGVEVVVTSASK
jgi:cytochrome P450